MTPQLSPPLQTSTRKYCEDIESWQMMAMALGLYLIIGRPLACGYEPLPRLHKWSGVTVFALDGFIFDSGFFQKTVKLHDSEIISAQTDCGQRKNIRAVFVRF
ncbi:hypothetical protein TNCV_1627451 [Trichonephila clavipes]|nr:hypothetical protein TNCV_1627451 [Trichonephila clavipes]